VLTYKRKKILTCDIGRKCLKDAIEKTRENHPFQMKCMCLLPEHFHCIMELLGEDKNYSLRLSLIKRWSTYHKYKKHGWKEDELMIDLYDENGFAD
jgi:putative transposase